MVRARSRLIAVAAVVLSLAGSACKSPNHQGAGVLAGNDNSRDRSTAAVHADDKNNVLVTVIF